MILTLTSDFSNKQFQGNFPAGFVTVDRETPAYWQVSGKDGTAYNVSKKTGYIVNEVNGGRYPNKKGAKFVAAQWEPA